VEGTVKLQQQIRFKPSINLHDCAFNDLPSAAHINANEAVTTTSHIDLTLILNQLLTYSQTQH